MNKKKIFIFAGIGLVLLCVLFVVIGMFASSTDETADVQTDGDQQSSDQQQPSDQEGSATQPPSAEGVVNTGFNPAENGFAYQNYGDTGVTPDGEAFPVINLTSVEMRRLFGDGVCSAPPTGDTCVLTPPAKQWMEQNNASMNGGHCEGFAVLSQMIYGGIIDPNQFGAARAIDLQIKDNEALQRELAYWWTTQGPTWNAQQILAPKDAITYLSEQYTNDPKNLFRLGIMKEDQTGGHAISVIA